MREGGELPQLLEAVARTIGGSLGYRAVAIDLFRPGPEDVRAAFGSGPGRAGEWTPALRDQLLRRGAFVVPGGESPDDPDAWRPGDALLVAMRSADGTLLGIISAGEPVSGRRPGGEELDVFVAFADHAALAVEAAEEGATAARHRRALEELLAVSSRLTGEPAVEEILRLVCGGIRGALGFRNVRAALVDPATGRVVPHATVGWSLADPVLHRLFAADAGSLLGPRFRREGCYLLTGAEARARLGLEPPDPDAGARRGAGEWDGHWLVVPLRGPDDVLLGLIWADGPDDGLLPSGDRLQALRIFANHAAAALVSGRHLDRLRFLADHDPLTRLLNRRAFVDRLEGEVARTARYGRSFGLVLADLDGFKQLNDRHGHAAGDEVLQRLASLLVRALRRPDDAFRIGGDEFALLLAEASEDDARAVARRTARLLAEAGDDRLAGLTVSFGCAACPDDAADPDTLVRLADAALYEAKRTGAGLRFAAGRGSSRRSDGG